jgi:energy-coupling factor transporter ATP-binding protein EcfA2
VRAPIIEVHELGFTYGGAAAPVLRDIDLSIDEGEMLLLVGPSGAGKSTLLRCFNGLVPHFHGGLFEGRVMVAGVDTRTRQPRDLASLAGLVFQDPEAQAVAGTVEDEIVFGLENVGADRGLIRRRLEEMLDALSVVHLRERRMATLSGGELQRVAIAAILTMHPRIVLLDEPTSQLDPQSADDVLRIVNDLRADLGITIVAAEHRLDRLAPYADRVLHLAGDGGYEVLSPRRAMSTLRGAPVVSRIGSSLGWSPLPLSIVEARRFAGRRSDDATPLAGTTSPCGAVIAEVDRLEVQLGGVPVLHGVSLALRRGTITALMGRNGAGKTTLLRALAGLAAPAAGVVRWSITGIDQARYRHLAYVAQDPSSMLYHNTAGDEIRDVLRGTRRAGSAAAALDEWRLAPLEHRNPRDLSVGERQRVALAAMLCGAPDVILLDEPTRGMDADTKDLLVANLRRRAEAGASVVIASHDVELAARCADRVVLLADGEVIADGPTRHVLTGSLVFTTQANKLLGGDVLTADDAIAHLTSAPA